MDSQSDIQQATEAVVAEILNDPYVEPAGHHVSESTVIYFKKVLRIGLILLTTSVLALVTGLVKSSISE